MDREKVIKEFELFIKEFHPACTSEGVELDMFREVLAMLKEQETKPLRCNECSYHRNDGWCNEHGREVKESDYCSFGAWEGR